LHIETEVRDGLAILHAFAHQLRCPPYLFRILRFGFHPCPFSNSLSWCEKRQLETENSIRRKPAIQRNRRARKPGTPPFQRHPRDARSVPMESSRSASRAAPGPARSCRTVPSPVPSPRSKGKCNSLVCSHVRDREPWLSSAWSRHPSTRNTPRDPSSPHATSETAPSRSPSSRGPTPPR